MPKTLEHARAAVQMGDILVKTVDMKNYDGYTQNELYVAVSHYLCALRIFEQHVTGKLKVAETNEKLGDIYGLSCRATDIDNSKQEYTLCALKHYHDALAIFESEAVYKPHEAHVLVKMGDMLEPKEALTHYRRALEIMGALDKTEENKKVIDNLTENISTLENEQKGYAHRLFDWMRGK